MRLQGEHDLFGPDVICADEYRRSMAGGPGVVNFFSTLVGNLGQEKQPALRVCVHRAPIESVHGMSVIGVKNL